MRARRSSIPRDERGGAGPLPLLDGSWAEKFRADIPYNAKSLPVTYLRSRELGETCGGWGRFQAAVKASGLSACLQIPTSGPSGLMQGQGEVKRNESLKMIADSGDHGKGDESLPPHQNARGKTAVWQNAITGKRGATRREDRLACLAAGGAFSATRWAEIAGPLGLPAGKWASDLRRLRTQHHEAMMRMRKERSSTPYPLASSNTQ
jgi:hypothetical protein